MTKTPDFAGGDAGASAPAREDTPAKQGKVQPMTRALVRATIDYNASGERIWRGQVFEVDMTLDATREALRRTWITPLPAAAQPISEGTAAAD